MQAEKRHRKLIRGVLSACFALFMGLCFHLLGGGHLPPAPVVLLLPLALSVLVCTLLAGSRKSLTRLIAGVAPSQIAFHAFLTAAEQSPHHPAQNVSGLAHSHASHLGASASELLPTGAPVHTHVLAPDYLSLLPAETQMLLSHLLATIITVAVFYRYELVFERIGACLTHLWSRFVILLRVLNPLGYPRTSPLGAVQLPQALPAITLNPHLLRGPPVPSFFC